MVTSRQVQSTAACLPVALRGQNHRKQSPTSPLSNGSTRHRACPTTCSPHLHRDPPSQNFVHLFAPDAQFSSATRLLHPHTAPHPPCPGKVGHHPAHSLCAPTANCPASIRRPEVQPAPSAQHGKTALTRALQPRRHWQHRQGPHLRCQRPDHVGFVARLLGAFSAHVRIPRAQH
jgi:hypothetical protein